jgi:hypothetical protein
MLNICSDICFDFEGKTSEIGWKVANMGMKDKGKPAARPYEKIATVCEKAAAMEQKQ